MELENRVKERTQELKHSQRLYKLIARNYPNGVISVLDKNLNYIFVEGKEMYKLGIDSESMIGTSFINRIDIHQRTTINEKLTDVFKGSDVSFEYETNGKIYLIHAAPLYNGDNVIERVLLVSQNISSLKKAEEDIQSALQKEIHLNEMKSRFVSTVSHEFRTPLTTILNSISLLSKYIHMPSSKGKQQKSIQRIKSSVENMNGILNDLLSIGQLEEGKVIIHFSEFDVSAFCVGTNR